MWPWQVRDLQEELGGREERWRAALARQRQRVEALEGQNRELQADLRMMERERLAWWQEQVRTSTAKIQTLFHVCVCVCVWSTAGEEEADHTLSPSPFGCQARRRGQEARQRKI